MIPDQPLGSITRQISYEFMNRQLVWSGFTVSPTVFLSSVQVFARYITTLG
jgi:hypothetical protein